MHRTARLALNGGADIERDKLSHIVKGLLHAADGWCIILPNDPMEGWLNMNLFQRLKDVYGRSRRPAVHIPDGPKTLPIRKRYCFSGYVQGVGFRYEAKMLADQLSLTGWVRNENDGTVTAEIEGQESCINEFLRVMQAVPRFDITDIQTEIMPVSGVEASFKML